MANLLARLRRGRTKSLSGANSLAPTLPATTPAPTPEAPLETPLERKIHPDLDSLVANWTPPERPVASTSVSDPASTSAIPPPQPLSTPLRPSTRRHSIAGTTPPRPPPPPDNGLDDLPELPVPIPFTALPQPPTRARRIITRLTGSSPVASTSNLATTSSAVGWSTFGRRPKKSNGADNSRPHLTDFGELEHGSPAPSSFSHSVSQSRSPSQVNIGTPSSTSQQLEESFTPSHSGDGHPSTPGSEFPSPASAFTFGSQGRISGRASTSTTPPPPMPPLDHPAFRGTGRTQSQATTQALLSPRADKGRPRSSSSLPSMSSSKQRKRLHGATGDRTKAQDIFASLRRPRSARPQRSVEFNAGQAAVPPGSGGEVDTVFLALGASGEREKDNKTKRPEDHFGPIDGDLRDNDFKFDARAKRVGGSSDSQRGEPFVWPDIPAHSPESSSSTMEQKKLGPPMLLPSVSFTVGTLEASPATPQERSTGEGPSSILHPPTPTRAHSDPNTRGKRKAEHIQGGITPPKDAKATGNLDPRPLQASHSTPSSTAPSSFKRAKTEPSPPRPGSRAGSVSAGHTGSASSRGSAPQPSRAPSRMSQASLPISALVAPHAPSVVSTNTAYHMRDPRKPPRIQPTGWGLEFGPGRWWQGGGSPLHAWLFFVGFVLFPVWWVAGLCVPIPRTRRLDAEEKSRGQVWLDDPQVEFDAKSWRKRCRIMAGVSLVTYVPFIVLLAVFLSRR